MALTDEQIAAVKADIKDIKRELTEAEKSLGFIKADSVPFEESILVPITQAQKDEEEVKMRANFTKIKSKADHAKDI